MAGQWDAWLRENARSGKGGIRLDAASRGRVLKIIFNLPGDWTGAALRGEIRIAPDAVGDPIAAFAVTGPEIVAGVSTFTCRLEPADFADIPADGDLDGVAEFPVDFLLEPAGGDEETLLAAVLPVTGRITE